MLPKAVEPSGCILGVLASNKEEGATSGNAKSTLGGLKSPPEILGTSEMPTASITMSCGTGSTATQGSSCSNNAEARKKVMAFIEQQNAAEQASRLAAAKQVVSVKNVDCDWVKIGACLFASVTNGPSLICCQVAGCKELIHHACQAE